jgi:hypothetical protein
MPKSAKSVIKKIVERVVSRFSPDKIILFGSSFENSENSSENRDSHLFLLFTFPFCLFNYFPYPLNPKPYTLSFFNQMRSYLHTKNG